MQEAKQGVPPPLEALAEEMRRQVQLNAEKQPGLVAFFREQGRRRPEYTAWSYTLGEIEHSLLLDAISKFGDAKVKLVAPIFNGAIVRPSGTRDGADLSAVTAHMKGKVDMVLKPFRRPSFSEAVRKRLRTLRPWKTWVPGPGEPEVGMGEDTDLQA